MTYYERLQYVWLVNDPTSFFLSVLFACVSWAILMFLLYVVTTKDEGVGVWFRLTFIPVLVSVLGMFVWLSAGFYKDAMMSF